MDPRLQVRVFYRASRTKKTGRTHPSINVIAVFMFRRKINSKSWLYDAKLLNCPWLAMSAQAKGTFLVARFRPGPGWVVGDATRSWGGLRTTKKPRGLSKGKPLSQASPTGKGGMVGLVGVIGVVGISDQIASCCRGAVVTTARRTVSPLYEGGFSKRMRLPTARTGENT